MSDIDSRVTSPENSLGVNLYTNDSVGSGDVNELQNVLLRKVVNNNITIKYSATVDSKSASWSRIISIYGISIHNKVVVDSVAPIVELRADHHAGSFNLKVGIKEVTVDDTTTNLPLYGFYKLGQTANSGSLGNSSYYSYETTPTGAATNNIIRTPYLTKGVSNRTLIYWSVAFPDGDFPDGWSTLDTLLIQAPGYSDQDSITKTTTVEVSNTPQYNTYLVDRVLTGYLDTMTPVAGTLVACINTYSANLIYQVDSTSSGGYDIYPVKAIQPGDAVLLKGDSVQTLYKFSRYYATTVGDPDRLLNTILQVPAVTTRNSSIGIAGATYPSVAGGGTSINIGLKAGAVNESNSTIIGYQANPQMCSISDVIIGTQSMCRSSCSACNVAIGSCILSAAPINAAGYTNPKNNVFIGDNIGGTGSCLSGTLSYNVLIGSKANEVNLDSSDTTTYAVVVGANSYAGSCSTTIGACSTSYTPGAIAIGASAASEGGITIGYRSSTITSGISIGKQISGLDGAIIIGDSASGGYGSESVTIGGNASGSEYSVVVGYQAAILDADYGYQVVAGNNAKGKGFGSIIIGARATDAPDESSEASDKDVILGYNASVKSTTSNGGSNVVIGADSHVKVSNTGYLSSKNTVIGSGINILGLTDVCNTIAIGYGATPATTSNIIQLGNDEIVQFNCKVALSTTSDRRDKTDIKSLDKNDMYDIVKQLNPVEFKGNSRELYRLEEAKDPEVRAYGISTKDYDVKAHARGDKKDSYTQLGLIAQEVEEVLSKYHDADDILAIVGDTAKWNKHLGIDTDKIKETHPDVESKKTIQYSKLVPILIGAIQKLQDEVERLKENV